MIRPLRDNLVAIPCEEVGMVGLLHMPPNKKQGLRTHRKMRVLYAGPKCAEVGIYPTTIVHTSDVWGDEFLHEGKTVWIGRARDINGVVV